MKPNITQMGQNATNAAQSLANSNGEQRQQALQQIITMLDQCKTKLFKANQTDIDIAKQKNITPVMIQRLKIDDKTFAYMKTRIKKLLTMPDPLGQTIYGITRPNGLQVKKITVPIGPIGIIYESRPNVTTDAAAVCLKSGNPVILRGGSEAIHTNTILADAIITAITQSKLPNHTIQIIKNPDRKYVKELLKLDQHLKLIIPRGGKNLIQQVTKHSTVPILKHYEGICHLYIAKDADPQMAINIAINSKCQRIEVCNALETLLIHKKAAAKILPLIYQEFNKKNIQCRGCTQTQKIIPNITPTTQKDWTTEYLAPTISIKIVENTQQAIQHINKYGSGHTDSIVCQSIQTANKFCQQVDSASVLINASTRLSGGGDYGLGAVVGISTDKLHARGPVGPQELTTYKWIVHGQGHLRK